MRVIETKTPFSIIENDNKTEYRIVIGNSLASEKTFESENAAKKYINSKPYELIGSLAVVLIQKIKEVSNE